MLFAVQGCRWFALIPPAFLSRNKFVISSVKTLKVSGRLCQKGSVFLKAIENSMPVFWRLSTVLILDNDKVFIFENLMTLYFSDDHFSFVVKPSETFCAISQFSSLLFNCPLQTVLWRSQSFDRAIMIAMIFPWSRPRSRSKQKNTIGIGIEGQK